MSISHTAEIAQLVEHNLAKVGVASSSLVFRSTKIQNYLDFFCFMVFAILSAAYEEQDHGNDNQREVSQF